MNKALNNRMEYSLGIVHHKMNRELTQSQLVGKPNTAILKLIQKLKDVQIELKQVKKERDTLKKEVLNCFRII